MIAGGRLFEWVPTLLTAAAVVSLLSEGLSAADRAALSSRFTSPTHVFTIYGLHIGGTGETAGRTTAESAEAAEVEHVRGRLREVIIESHARSLIDYPCRKHRNVLPHVLSSISTHDTTGDPPFQYFCADTDSGELAQSHFAVREAVGVRKGLHYVRVQRLTGNSRGSRKIARADLFFGWDGTWASGPNATQDLRALLLDLRYLGVRSALVGAPVALVRPTNTSDQDPVQRAELGLRDRARFTSTSLPCPGVVRNVFMDPAHGPSGKVLVLYDVASLPEPDRSHRLSARKKIQLDLERSRRRSSARRATSRSAYAGHDR